MTALFIAALLSCQLEQELAIAIAINAPRAEQQSVVIEPEPVPVVQPKPVQQYTTREEKRTKRVWGKVSCGRWGCRYGWINQEYTVRVKVPVESAATKSWPRYPTSPRQRPWTQSGRHITWRHLTQGEHAGKFNAAWLQSLSRTELEQLHADEHENKVQWSRVVRP